MAARSRQLDTTLFTILRKNTSYDQRGLVNYWKKQPGTKITITKNSQYEKAVASYFKRQCFMHRRVVVHLRKQPADIFMKLRAQTGGRLRTIVEIEGDPKLEADFLREHQYKPGFYDSVLANMERQSKEQESLLIEADHVLVVSNYLRDNLCKRYPHLQLAEKITVLPTGATLVGNKPNRDVREHLRSKNGWSDNFLITYVGNVFYSWQSLSCCLSAFKLIRKQLQPKAKLLILVREQDWTIAQDFIARARLSPEDYYLSNVAPHKVGAYMSACDLGLLLRPTHPALLAASPGKFGDYILNGLPVLMSAGVGEYAEMVRKDGLFPIVNDIDSTEQILDCADQLLTMTWKDRERLAEWGRDNISSMASAQNYAEALESVAQLTYTGL